MGRTRWVFVHLLALVSAAPLLSQQIPYAMHASVAAVDVNLSVRDGHGQFVRGLQPDDITVLEDGKPQRIASIEFHDLNAEPAAGSTSTTPPRTAEEFAGHRLIVIYLDITTMIPENANAVIASAHKFIAEQMQPTDLVAIAVLAQSLNVTQEFTADKDALNRALDAIDTTAGSGFTQSDANAFGANGLNAHAADPFQPDMAEIQILDLYRSYMAIQVLSDILRPFPGRKAVLLFASGFFVSGVDNDYPLRVAVNAAVKSDVALYGVDSRGLCLPPKKQLDCYVEQEPLSTFSTETGGTASFESNDFLPEFERVQADSGTYYLITYDSSNPKLDGAYHHIQVKVDRPGVMLDFRRGYYAEKDYAHLNAQERQARLTAQLATDRPDTALPFRLQTHTAALSDGKYRLTMEADFDSGAVPSGAASIDLETMVRKTTFDHGIVATHRATIHRSGSVWTYIGDFNLPPGTYELGLAAQEMATGKAGAQHQMVQVPHE